MARLHAVADGETAPPKKVLTVATAASEGSRRDLLVAMRDRIATAVGDPNTAARDLAALTRRLMEIAKDIEALDARELEESEGGGVVPDQHLDAASL
jgi:hypothetical protein